MIPAKPFYLIRHGQSEANAIHQTAGGGLDSELTPLGRSQAMSLAPYLSTLELKPGVIHHSTMIRARDTAVLLNASLKLEMHPSRDLREHEMGDWEGLPWAEVLPRIDNDEPPPNGESQQQFAQRIQSIFTDILNMETERVPMFVAHGGLYHALGTLYEYGISPVQNCHLHLYEPEPSFGRFPWRVSVFDLEKGGLVKKPSNFCLSQAMADIS